MAMAQNEHANGASSAQAPNSKKRKGFWANIFSKSSSSNTDEKKEGRWVREHGATKGAVNIVEGVAKKEIEKEIEGQLDNNNNNGDQQPENLTTTSAIAGTRRVGGERDIELTDELGKEDDGYRATKGTKSRCVMGMIASFPSFLVQGVLCVETWFLVSILHEIPYPYGFVKFWLPV
ncbi:hypothetical protein JVU11DRAFT_8260 [Chiua virens]|nr:hypothetical protein JVU11DRAFT_8260 [Chiua virens]